MAYSALIPFSGFYYSWHDEAFDSCLERMFDPEGTGASYAGQLQYRFFETVKWHDAQTSYAKTYVAEFAHALGTQCEWEEMVSPREYNFGTDRLFAKFPESFMRECFADADIRAMLDTVSRDMFTSRSGFISSYSNDVASWGDMTEWDHNQFGALLKAAANVRLADGEDFGQEQEFALCEDFDCNGNIDNWIWENADADLGNRCDRIASYLAQREAR